MQPLDPRLHPYRPDLAGEELRGRVTAARFATGTPAQVAAGVADLREAPSEAARLSSQLLSGEQVTLYDEAEGWAWVQNRSDGYVGYVAASALTRRVESPTHRVTALRSFRFPDLDVKAPPLDHLTLSGLVAVIGTKGKFSEVAGGGWVYGSHLAALDAPVPDYVATALRFLGAPYLWGGKESLGLDCSGLIQVVLALAGIPAARDSDQQTDSLGAPVPGEPDDAEPRRGDLIYMPGHAVIALDATRVVHANASDMLVTVEALAALVERVEAECGRGITAIRRLALDTGAGA